MHFHSLFTPLLFLFCIMYQTVVQQQHSQLVLDPRRYGERVARLDVLEDLVVAQPLEVGLTE